MNLFEKLSGWFTGPIATHVTGEAVSRTILGDTVKGELKAQVEEGVKLLQLGLLPNLSWRDESGFERVKEELEEEMIKTRHISPEDAAAMTEEFDRYLERIPWWRATIFRYVVMSQEEMKGRLSVLRRMFSLTDPITDEKRNQIMRNIASEEPVMMKFGEWIRKEFPKFAGSLNDKGISILEFFRDALTNTATWLWEKYQGVVDPYLGERAEEISRWRIQESIKRRKSYGLRPKP